MQPPGELIPRPYACSEAWWAAAAAGRLTVQRCSACGHAQLYPRAHCTRCWSDDVRLVDAGGHGVVHSWTVTHRHPEPAFEPPFAYAIVELDEGPRLTTLLRGVDPADVHVGLAVEVTFAAVADGVALPSFVPRHAGQDGA